ncbi:MAG: ABC transporter ATP-binding protein [Streptococcaceae bacterium]|jgi:ABC-2 type transport system ATP-binding protein|nr:ABC transporter ATP-binding protein [Streptococcaceae bacterium]
MKIEVNQLQFAYGERPILGVKSVAFESGKIYGIVGKNGVGKTTFFKNLTNIITNYRGSVLIDGVDVRTNPAILSKVGINLDDMQLYKGHTGEFNLHYFGGLRGGFDAEKVQELAKALNIDEALKQKVSKYSLGMTRKLILLISLMNDAEVLIFDEPFRGIDQASVVWLRDYLLNLKKLGRLILVSSHVQEDIESLCDEVLILENGDFSDPFDLKDAAQILIYTVETKQADSLVKILIESNIKTLTKPNMVRFESTKDNFQEIFRKSVAAGVEFDEIKKESQFADMLSGGTK